jgi:hypothetical protein
MYPGQTATLNVQYSNEGDVEVMDNAVLKVYIGDTLSIDPNSLTDKFDTDPVYRVDSSVVTKRHPNWGTYYEYQPRSAKNSSAPSGLSTKANVTMPLGKKGSFSFAATLDADILNQTNPMTGQKYKIGSILSQPDLQGVNGFIDFDGNGSMPGSVAIKIIANPVQMTVTYNPKPGVVGEQFIVKGETVPTAATQCVITLSNTSGYTKTKTVPASNGTCNGIFASNETPTIAGTYQLKVEAGGQTNTQNVDFIVKTVVLPRSGGMTMAMIGGILGAILVLYLIQSMKKRKMAVSSPS